MYPPTLEQLRRTMLAVSVPVPVPARRHCEATGRHVLLDLEPCAAAEGWGEFVDPHTVKISLSAGGEQTVTAQTILIATGGRAVKAPIEGSVSTLRG